MIHSDQEISGVHYFCYLSELLLKYCNVGCLIIIDFYLLLFLVELGCYYIYLLDSQTFVHFRQCGLV